MDQTAAGAKCGISNVSINRYEAGVKTPSLATLYKLARGYGVDVCDLLPPDAVIEPEPPPPPKKGKTKKK